MGYFQDLILSKTSTQTQIDTAFPDIQALLIDTGTANVVKLYGGKTTTGDDLLILPNTTDTKANILLEGNGNVVLGTATGGALKIQTPTGTDAIWLYPTGTDSILMSKITNNDLYLATTGTGVIKFGTYTAGAATDSTGYITIKDAAGNTRKLMVQA